MKSFKPIVLTVILSCILSICHAQLYTDEVQLVEGLGGKVGIGTNDPQYNLDVNGSAKFPIIYLRSAGSIDDVVTLDMNSRGRLRYLGSESDKRIQLQAGQGKSLTLGTDNSEVIFIKPTNHCRPKRFRFQ